jgi:hypothetical protein
MTTRLGVVHQAALLLGELDGEERVSTLTAILNTMDIYFLVPSDALLERKDRELLYDYLRTIRDEAKANTF